MASNQFWKTFERRTLNCLIFFQLCVLGIEWNFHLQYREIAWRTSADKSAGLISARQCVTLRRNIYPTIYHRKTSRNYGNVRGWSYEMPIYIYICYERYLFYITNYMFRWRWSSHDRNHRRQTYSYIMTWMKTIFESYDACKRWKRAKSTIKLQLHEQMINNTPWKIQVLYSKQLATTQHIS